MKIKVVDSIKEWQLTFLCYVAGVVTELPSLCRSATEVCTYVVALCILLLRVSDFDAWDIPMAQICFLCRYDTIVVTRYSL